MPRAISPIPSVFACAIAVLLACAAVPPCAAEGGGLICGGAKKAGVIKLKIYVKKGLGDPETHEIELFVGDPNSFDAETKATIFRAGAKSLDDKVTFRGSGADVNITGKDGWKVTGVSVADDTTNEPDRTYLASVGTGMHGLCSLSGTASGQSPDTLQAFVQVAVNGHVAHVPTFPGMPAASIEQQIFTQLASQGVQVHPATPQELAPFAALQHDGSVLWIDGLNPSALSVDVRDTGLTLDVSAVVDTSPVADLDDDGVVGQSDLGILLGDFGCNAGPGNCPGDIDADGQTGQTDLGILLSMFGQ